jgi:Swi5-dependent recombination DNA repair protein 1
MLFMAFPKYYSSIKHVITRRTLFIYVLTPCACIILWSPIYSNGQKVPMDQGNSRRHSNLYSHAAKRQRVEAASHTLSKPFRSPFKSTSKPQKNLERRASADSPDLLATSDEKKPVELTHPDRRTPSSPSPLRVAESRRRSRTNFSNEPVLNLLLKEERGLERELKGLRAELDTVEQARKIETKEEDEELVGLIEKWRGAARAAAEEVFKKVSDRVNRYA